MLKMPQQHYIKFLREVEGCSVKEIAARVSVHWRTAKKYAGKCLGILAAKLSESVKYFV
ncbi:hypothetical protein LOY85_14505 [Brevibacillus brevis]|uniref:hypothetical protein n=1 Tax=Brevibacillus brevis TaxID=1393 RepID=UPI001F1AA7F1|nr:hypothetical protein [Brevibacillus brevis]UIO40035.1 hypothetical protein LOY85_14505 [Brevibacillus brevis]